MVKEIQPSGPLQGVFTVPGSKSITNRALACAALAKGESLVRNASDSDDTALMANGLNQLGVLVRKTANGLVVHGTDAVLTAPKFPIPAGNAGTTLRFLMSLSALAKGHVVIEGSARMAERPNEDLLEALRTLGVPVMHKNQTARFEIDGGSMRGGTVHVKGSKSSQFVSSILLAAPYAGASITIEVDGPLASSTYVDITLAVMASFGVTAERIRENVFRVEKGQRYQKADYRVEADASGAAYGFGAAAITGGEVTVTGLRIDSFQGDIGFVELLRRMGCAVEDTAPGVRVVRAAALRGIDVEMNVMPDVVPTLAAVALFAEGKTRIRNVAHLRHKESDRLRALTEELTRLGASVTEMDDGLEITPVPLHGATLDPRSDHRLAMSFALVGLRIPGVTVRNPECVTKSFPGFWSEIERLRRPAGIRV